MVQPGSSRNSGPGNPNLDFFPCNATAKGTLREHLSQNHITVGKVRQVLVQLITYSFGYKNQNDTIFTPFLVQKWEGLERIW